MKIAVVDTETSGENPEEGAELVEAAVVVVDLSTILDLNAPPKDRWVWRSFIQPERPIPPTALAVHHITPEVLEDGPTVPREFARDAILSITADCAGIAAHNAAFDRRFLPELADFPWLCTCNIAKHLWPDAPKFGLQVLRYWRNLQPKNINGMHPHRALYDTLCCVELLIDQVRFVDDGQLPLRTCLAYLGHLSCTVPIQRTCHFGKYRGRPWSQVPRDYLYWILRQEFDEEIMVTAKHYSMLPPAELLL